MVWKEKVGSTLLEQEILVQVECAVLPWVNESSATELVSTVCSFDKRILARGLHSLWNLALLRGGACWKMEGASGERKGEIRKSEKPGESNFTSNCSHSGTVGINTVEICSWKMDSLPLILFSDLLTGSGLVFGVTFQLAKPPEVWIQAGRSLPG